MARTRNNSKKLKIGSKLIASGYTPNPVWKMSKQDKDDYLRKMIKRWQSGEETVPLPSDLNPSGIYMQIPRA